MERRNASLSTSEGLSLKESRYLKIAWDTFQTQIFDYEGGVEEIHDWIRSQGYKVQDVLEIGCGAARYLAGLRRLGYNCSGVDRDVEVLEYAKTLLQGGGLLDVELVQGDVLKNISSEIKSKADIVLGRHLSFPFNQLESQASLTYSKDYGTIRLEWKK